MANHDIEKELGRVVDEPYRVDLRLGLVKSYEDLGYPDLAAGEAYKALLLLDEIVDDCGEYHEEAVEAAKIAISESGQLRTDVEEPEEEEEAIDQARALWSISVYTSLAKNFLTIGCLKSAYEYCTRGLTAHPEIPELKEIKSQIDAALRSYFARHGWDWDNEKIDVNDYPDRGFVRRELYSWNTYEPDRFSAESLEDLNSQLRLIAPKLEVRATDLPFLTDSSDGVASDGTPKTVKQLGVFAATDIPAGEEILNERSLLTATSRLHDTFCDACSARLPSSTSDTSPQPTPCLDCDDTLFCSPTCHDLAQTTYHPALCGADVEAIARDAPAAEAADALYSLLLIRTMAMAETQDVHPLTLREVKYIWGDYTFAATPAPPSFATAQKTLPWSPTAHLFLPLHVLEKMDRNIFDNGGRYDGWVLNTLYAKFRGTASARQGPDGRPEVGAVHPLWCLANHDCDPNVRWAWEGSMCFWVRTPEERVQWVGRQGERERVACWQGLRKDEEVLGHYCDVGLPVKERREWAAGALGGLCMCRRCRWEAGVEEKEVTGGMKKLELGK